MAKKHVIAIAGFVILVNLFLFRMFGSTALVLLSLGFSVYLITVLPVGKFIRKHELTAAALLVLTTLPLILIELRASSVIWAGLFLAYLLAVGYGVYLVSTGATGIRSVTELVLAIPSVALSHLANLLGKFLWYLNAGTPSRSRPVRRIATITVGVLLGLPVVAILLGLLTGADPIFAKSVSQIMKYLSLERVLVRAFVSAVALFISTPFIGIAVAKTPGIRYRLQSDVSDAVTVVTLLVAAVAGAFLVIQWPYVFAAVARETDLSRFGVATYSEYVRRGFAELLTAGLLMYGISWVGYVSERSRKSLGKFSFTVQMIVLLELGVFIVSVLRRVFLYWQFHGLTLIRFYGGLFLITVLILTAILILRHFFRRVPWVRAEIGILILMVFFTGVFNAEKFIVHNHPPTVNGRIDYVYLSRLSPDGYDGWLISYRWAEDTVFRYRLTAPGDMSEDDLRQLSYAGSVIATLTRTYLRLIGTYGSAADRQQSAELLRQNWLIHVDAYRKDVEHDLMILASGKTASGTLDRFLDFGANGDPKQRTLENQRREAVARLSSFGSPAASSAPVSFYRFAPSPVFRFPDFANRTCSYEQMTGTVPWCMPEFYTIRTARVSEPTDLDRFYLTNARTAGVYASLSRKIPLASLLETQNAFLLLHRRIMTSPVSVKSVPWDISTESLFLEFR